MTTDALPPARIFGRRVGIVHVCVHLTSTNPMAESSDRGGAPRSHPRCRQTSQPRAVLRHWWSRSARGWFRSSRLASRTGWSIGSRARLPPAPR